MFLISGADTVQLNIIFTDIKGLQTNVNYHLITEADLDQLTEDVSNFIIPARFCLKSESTCFSCIPQKLKKKTKKKL